METRSYNGLQDLYAMLDLLSDGRKANNGTYYVHRGDLQWWLFYTDVPQETWQSNIRLWFEEDCLIGWALLSSDENTFDVYAAPHVRGSAREAEMLAWAVEQMSALDRLQTLWVAEDDEVRIRWLEENEFTSEQEHFVRFQRSLSGTLDGPPLPARFNLRASRGEEDARLRSVCSHAAFGSSKPFEEYWPRTLRFMQSPVYVAKHELFVVAPNGDIAAYCIVWTDEPNSIGHFEPVGTHPDYQRKGLGRSLLFEAFRRLKAEGMNEADVCTNYDNPAAIRLYESVGFQIDKRLLTYVKRKKMNTYEIKAEEAILPKPLSLRAAKWSDVDAVAQLVYEACAADGDTTVAMSAEEIRHEWEDPSFNLERDVFIVETTDGRVVGYEEFFNEHEHVRLRTDGDIHPDFKGRGIGTALLRAVDKRAREELTLAKPGMRVSLHSTISNRDSDGHNLHRNEGYQPIRYHWRMEIVLDGPPPEPKFPDGIELRPFIKDEHDVAVWQAQNEAWRDHWGSHDISLEEWRRSRFDDPEFNPSLWAIAWDGDEVAGFSMNPYRMGIGWIRTLGVRRPWRKRGLGEALLLRSFGEFYQRGTKTIGLGVDAQNPTGATRLYQKVGMYAASEYVTYEKELRPGHDIGEE